MPRKNKFLQQLTAAGITQADFARYIGKTRRTVTRWANNETPVPPNVMRELEVLLRHNPEGRKRIMRQRAAIYGHTLHWVLS